MSPIFEWLERSHWRASALLLLVCLALYLPGLSTLPPMDRDEPRFAQATKQMLESGDLVDIRFQGEARHKKPVGIYWMQAAVVSTAQAAGISDARATIWLYRLPSLVGAILAVLFTYAAAARLTTRRAAVLAAGLFAATILIGVEARLAKTDAVLTATVVACMAALARAWMVREEPGARLPWAWSLLFWVGMAIGILVKGPLTPAIVGLAAVTLALTDRSVGWLRRLRPASGLLLVLVFVLPWFVAITVKSGGAFFEEAVGQDMLGKVATGQESHGAPPGTYLAAFFGTAWPMAPFVLLAVPFAWRKRLSDPVLFCIAWVVPMWLVFEAVPTKLPHYVLPLYPGLAILVALAAEAQALRREGVVARLVMALVPVLIVALAIATTVGLVRLDHVVPWRALPVLAVASLLGALAWLAYFQGRYGSAVAGVVAASVLLSVAAYGLSIPLFRSLAISPRLAAMASSAGCPVEAYATAGYREPSLVFLTRTDLVMTDGAGAAWFLREPTPTGRCRIAFVEKRLEEAFIRGTLDASTPARLVGRIEGLNLNGGRKLDIGVYAGP